MPHQGKAISNKEAVGRDGTRKESPLVGEKKCTEKEH